jgi:hypothetical protein
MKKTLLAVIFSVLTTPAFAAEQANTEENNLELCKVYAKDDGVTADEMEEYLKNCLNDLKESAGGKSD